MICPCCSVGNVSSDSETCDLCGYSVMANVALGEGQKTLPASPTGADPSRTTARFSAEGTAGRGTAIRVAVCGADGKPLTRGGDTVVVAVTGANRARPVVTDVGNGTYTATYTPAGTGQDNLSITLNGVPIGGSPFAITVSPGAADAGRTTATVPPGVAGEPSTLTIATRDANGNELTSGGDSVEVSIEGANATAKAEVTDHGDSRYTAVYQPTVSGIDEIGVSVGGIEIAGSPFTSTVSSGPPNARQSTATVPEKASPGRGAAITVRARDAHGNRVTRGGAAVQVQIAGANHAVPAVHDQGNGSYTATYTPTVIGADSVTVTLDGAPVPGSPFTIAVEAGQADVNQTVAMVPVGRAGKNTTVHITARDAHGNRLETGGAALRVTVTGANGGEASVTDNGDGTYDATYRPTIMGSDQLTVLLDGAEIIGSPFTSIVEAGPPVAGQTRTTVPRSATAGQPTTMLFETRDAHQNELATGGATLGLTVSGANAGASVAVTDNENGTYSATYTPTKAGTDEITVTLNGEPVSSRPFRTQVLPGSADQREATVDVPDGRAGVPTAFKLITRDAFGNETGVGGLEVAVVIAGANEDAEVDIRDSGDGTYVASYTPVVAGTDFVTVLVNGSAIADSPRTSRVAPGPVSTSRSEVTIPSATRAGTLTTMAITTRDGYGNRLSHGGGSVMVAVAGANEAAQVAIVDNGDGTYLATYTPTVHGIDEFTVRVNGDEVDGHPHVLTVDPATADASTSAATGPALGRVGVPISFAVRTCDKYGNALASGGADVAATVTGVNTAADVLVTDRRDGTYTVTYTPIKSGKDSVSVSVNGKPLGSGPLRPTIAVGTASAARSTAKVQPGRAGRETEIIVRARDASGNDLSVGGDKVMIGVSVANTATPEVTDLGDGTYRATYTPSATGTDYIAISINGAALAGSPYISEVSPGSTDLERTEVAVPAVGLAGTPTNVFVRTRDRFGNAIKHGGQLLQVSVGGANDGTSLTVTDNQDGTYVATYTPTKAGEDSIGVRVSGESVGTGAFKSLVQPGLPSAAQTTASIPDGRAGELTRATVVVRDAYRNQVSSSVGRLKIAVSGSNQGATVQVTDNRDGTYTATYTPTIAGTDLLTVTIDGAAIGESPYRAKVEAGEAAADRTRCEVADGVAGMQTTVTVTARDTFGNPLRRGGDRVSVAVSGANEHTEVEITDNHDGTYTARYRPVRTGADTFAVRINDASLDREPVRSLVRAGPTDPTRTTAVVPAGRAGSTMTIRVTARDAHGNLVGRRGDRIHVTVEGSNAGAHVTVGDEPDGTYTASYTPTVAGSDTISVSINDRQIGGSPFGSVVGAGAADPARCSATVPRGKVGTPTTITMVVRDTHGNQLARGGEAVEVKVGGANAGTPVYINDLGNGTYTASYTPNATGHDLIEIVVNGTALRPEPFRAEVTDRISGAAESEPEVALPAVPDAGHRPSTGRVRAGMMCPRCSVSEISEETNRCELCGFSPTVEPATAPASRPSLSALHSDVQRELGNAFKLQTVVRQTERSVVFLAQDVARDQPVVIKVLPLEDPEDTEFVRRFREDLHRVKSLTHPGLVPILEHGTTPGFVWYSMPHIDGRTLADVLGESGSLPVNEALEIVSSVATTLNYVHQFGRVHGNLKPDNILLGWDDVVYVTDGCLQHLRNLSEYMAPEQFTPGKVDARADQYSLGLITYECLLGAHPLIGRTPGDMTAEGQVELRRRLLEERPDVPAGAAAALERAVSQEAAERFLNVMELVTALGVMRPSIPVQRLPEVEPPPRAVGGPRVLFPEAEARPLPIKRIALGLAVLLAAVAYWYFGVRPSGNVISAPLPPTLPVADPMQVAPPAPEAADVVLDSVGATGPAIPTAAPARISVSSSPTGALYVDGTLVGNTPREGLVVRPGRHLIRIERAGYAAFEREIEVGAGETFTIADIVLVPQG